MFFSFFQREIETASYQAKENKERMIKSEQVAMRCKKEIFCKDKGEKNGRKDPQKQIEFGLSIVLVAQTCDEDNQSDNDEEFFDFVIKWI